jgi:hypothetical protein
LHGHQEGRFLPQLLRLVPVPAAVDVGELAEQAEVPGGAKRKVPEKPSFPVALHKLPIGKSTPPHLRVFLSSPGDVADERGLARRLLKEELAYERQFRDRVTFDVVSWDDPAAPTPMLATLPPQEAVNRGLPKPSECDVVVVILWSRMGTPLPADQYQKPSGEPYLSGTEWEFEDARTAERKPDILIYQRSEVPQVAMDDPESEEKFRQYRLVKEFISKQCRTPTGALRGGVNTYATPREFKELLVKHLRDLVWRRVSEPPCLRTS